MGMARKQALCKGVDQRVRDALEAGRVAGRIILLNDCASRSLGVRFKRFSETLHLKHCISQLAAACPSASDASGSRYR
jgi:hypothetical protein